MTDYKTIDDLPAGTPNGTDNLEVSQGGVSRRVTFAQVGGAAGPLPFLPLAGGTLTGNLAGTTAAFSGEISAANPALGDNDTTVATTKWVKDQAYAGAAGFLPIGGGTLTGPLAGTTAAFTGNVTMPTQAPATNNTTGATTAYVTAAVAASPAGSVTTVSVVNANGLNGTVANPTSAPAITLSTSVTGVLKGNGTAISAAVANSDYLPTTNPTFNGTMTGGAYAGTTAAFSAAPAYPNNTTSVATTAFVTAGIAAVSGGGPFLPLTGGTLAGPGTLTGTSATFSGNVAVGTLGGSNNVDIKGTNAVDSLIVRNTAGTKFVTVKPESATDTATFGYFTGAPWGTIAFPGPLTGTTATFTGTVTAPGAQIQMVFTETGAVATGTTIIPADDTIPQITEGDQFMSLAITPKSATSRLIIEIIWHGGFSLSGNVITAALFQDSTANALAVGWTTLATAGTAASGSFRHVMTSGTTSATTFRVRIGAQSAGTFTFNGTAAGRFMGGTLASSIVIQEVAP